MQTTFKANGSKHIDGHESEPAISMLGIFIIFS